MHIFSFIFHFIILLFPFSYALKKYDRPDDLPGVIAKTIIVDKQGGQGSFTSVQKAIDSIPSNNNIWTNIHAKPGIYVEKVKIPRDKPFIVLSGESSGTTIIQWDEAVNSIDSATLYVDAENFVAVNISFKNTYNHVLPHTTGGHGIIWAPAATIFGDKVSFHRCGFVSVQDTLTDMAGRHFFESCYIEGAIDFIWGSGQSIYKGCVINATTAILNGVAGYITAQGRDSANKTDGFVFIACNIVGNGPVYLGRAYHQYSRVLFKKTYMSNIVKPDGWSAWDQDHEELITFSEANCIGPGANMSGRVKWEKKLSPRTWRLLTNISSFINQEGWIERQPKLQ